MAAARSGSDGFDKNTRAHAERRDNVIASFVTEYLRIIINLNRARLTSVCQGVRLFAVIDKKKKAG